MTNKLDKAEKGEAKGDRVRAHAYLRDFVPAMLLYGVTMVIAGTIGNDTTWKKWFFVGINLLPIGLVVRAVVRSIRRSDEFERLTQFKGMAIGFGVTMVTSLICAFMASAEIQISALVAGWAPFMTGMLAWGLYVGPRLNTMGPWSRK
jgi:hypothetical protein